MALTVRKATLVFLWAALLWAAASSAGEITVASWNIRMLSAASRDGRERGQIADRLAAFDMIAIQEVRDDDIVGILVDMLRARGLPFAAVTAPALGAPPREA